MNNALLFKKTIGRQLKEIQRRTQQLLYRYDAKAVHELRVASLRTAFALKFFPPVNDKVNKVRRRLKETRGVMGDARNLDVLFLRTKKNIKDLHLTFFQRKNILSFIQDRRNKSQHALTTALKSPAYARLLKDLKQIKNHHPVAGFEAVIKGPFRKSIANLLNYHHQSINSGNLHQIRKSFKKLRYGCEFLGIVDKARMGKALKFIKKFQDLLGDRQDSITAVDLLSGFPGDGIRELIKMEKKNIKDCQKKFEKHWRKSSSKHSMIHKLNHWSRRYS